MTEPSGHEAFIPVSRFALIDRLTRDPAATDDYSRFLNALAALQHQHYRQKLQRLKMLYLPFSPDRDTLRVLEYSEAEKQDMRSQLIDELTHLLERANYSRIHRSDLERIFNTQSDYGLALRVDLSEYDDVLLFARGAGTETGERRTAKSLFLRKESYTIPMFQRLFLLLKLKPESQRLAEIKDERGVSDRKAQKLLKKYRSKLPETISSDHIYLKTFKNIPQIDLEMLFPNTEVKLKPLDKLKLGVTAGGGTVGSAMGAFTKFAAAANPLAAAGVLFGLAGVIFRQVKKFFTQKNKYMMVMAQKLYFHNLANNRGVLTLLTDRAEEEAIKECFLLYHALFRKNTPCPADTLKQEIDVFVSKEFGAKIDFDLNSPAKALEETGILQRDHNDCLSALPPTEALARIEAQWKATLQQSSNLY